MLKDVKTKYLDWDSSSKSTQVEHLVDLVDLVEHTGGPNRPVRTKIQEQGAGVGLGEGTVAIWGDLLA